MKRKHIFVLLKNDRTN